MAKDLPTALVLPGDPDDDVMCSVEPSALRRASLDNGYVESDVTAQHALATASLPSTHRHPFDRLPIAQSVVEGATLLTADATILRYPGPIRRV